MALCNAFIVILGEKKFEDITVNELCDRAMVRRATFYKHFADKYDFFGFFIREMQATFEQQLLPIDETLHPADYITELTKMMIDFLEIHHNIVMRVLESNLMPTLLDIFGEQVTFGVKQRLKEEQAQGRLSNLSAEFCAVAYTGAVLQILRWWYAQNPRLGKEALLEQMNALFQLLSLQFLEQ